MCKKETLTMPENAPDIDAVSVSFADDRITAELKDGRIVSVPLSWYPVIQKASDEDRNAVDIRRYMLRWPHLDELFSTEHMIVGIGDVTNGRRHVGIAAMEKNTW